MGVTGREIGARMIETGNLQITPDNALLSDASRIGTGSNLGASLHQFIERERVSKHELVRQHVRVVGRERFARRSFGHDLKYSRRAPQ